jgi:hypothetical protein
LDAGGLAIAAGLFFLFMLGTDSLVTRYIAKKGLYPA